MNWLRNEPGLWQWNQPQLKYQQWEEKFGNNRQKKSALKEGTKKKPVTHETKTHGLTYENKYLDSDTPLIYLSDLFEEHSQEKKGPLTSCQWDSTLSHKYNT